MTEPTESPKKKLAKGQGAFVKNQLPFAQKLRIVRFLEARRDRLMEERPPFAAVALDAAEELGIPVCESNVRAAGKAAGVYWKARQAERPEHMSSRAGKKVTTKDIIELQRRQIEMLHIAIVHLYEIYGDVLPKGLADDWPARPDRHQDNGHADESMF